MTTLLQFFLMLVASFSGLYCSIIHLHVYQYQPASLMNTQQLDFSVVPYNHARPKRGLIHQDIETSVIRPLLYLQATTAGSLLQLLSIP